MLEQELLNKASESFLEQDYVRSRKYITRLLESKNPQWMAFGHLNNGVLLQIQGRFDEADREILKCLELNPDCIVAAPSRAVNKKFTESDGYHTQLLKYLDKANCDEKIRILFALGKVYDDMDRYDEAFSCFREGNEKKRATLHPERVIHRINCYIEELYTYCTDHGTVEYLRSLGSDHPMIFIVGLPRSGTTLMESILDKHQKLYGAGEVLLIPPLFGKLCENLKLKREISFKPLLVAKKHDISPLVKEYLSSVVKNKQIPIDKNPNNYRYLAFIRSLFPNCKIIHMVRDPMDTLCSCYFRLFDHNQDWAFSFDDIVANYSQYKMLMEHAKKYLELDMMEVSYEELVRDHEKTTRKVLDFLGLKFSRRCLDTVRTRETNTASMWQVRQPVYQSSIGKWKHYEKHLENMKKKIDEIDSRSYLQICQ